MSFIKKVSKPVTTQLKKFDSWLWLKLEIALAPFAIKVLTKFIKWLDKRIKKDNQKKRRKAQIQAVKDMSGLL